MRFLVLWVVIVLLCLVGTGCFSNDDSRRDRPAATGAVETPQDMPGTERYYFYCGDAGQAEFRFLGPETIEVSVAGSRHVMQREISASGARYANEDAEFWIKGDEAMLTLAGTRYSCDRDADTRSEP